MTSINSMQTRGAVRRSKIALLVASLFTAAALTACGGGAQDTAAPASVAPADLSSIVVSPTFHLAPAELAPPAENLDLAAIHTEALLPGMETLSSAALLPETIHNRASERRAALHQMAEQGVVPNATPAKTVTVYTPAQVRAAYRLATVVSTAVPANGAARDALGAGQTIYLIDANDNPNAFSDLNTFSRQFGLPACSNLAITAATPLPLPAASSSAACTFSVVYATASGKITSTAPAYDSGWATEIALDVQEAHAIAPLARIVLIEVPTAATSALVNGVLLANSMGSGMVSMSFGAAEGSWMSSLDTAFQGKNMQYFASTGDSGTGVNWPSVSARVVAVGGTSLTYNGSSRSEVVWSGTGGGTSRYVAVPSYQSALSTTIAYRRATDVALDSDPYTGQYVAFTPKGGTLGWFSGGGTSIASPAWAAMAAIINAQRAAGGLAMLPSLQNALYLDVLPSASSYGAAFLDVVSGADGSCPACSAGTGYDAPSGLGTPNASALVAMLSTVKQ